MPEYKADDYFSVGKCKYLILWRKSGYDEWQHYCEKGKLVSYDKAKYRNAMIRVLQSQK